MISDGGQPKRLPLTSPSRQALQEYHPIVKLGGQGLALCDAAGCRHLPAIPVPVVDTTAAGDAFCGALAAWLAGGAAFDDALRCAIAAGALAVTVLGAQPSLPTLAAVEELLQNNNLATPDL